MTKNQMIKYIEDRKRLLEYQINRIKSSILSAPEGSIIVRNERNINRYYHNRPDGITKYTTDIDLIRNVVQKQYDKKVLDVLQHELRLINKFLAYPTDKLLSDILSGFGDGKKSFIEPISFKLTDEEYVKRWLAAPYTPKGFAPDTPEHYSMKGLRVRSKSEEMIADMMDMHEVPFFYEYRIVINGIAYHPDFTCLNRRTRNTYYWEHLGKMGDPEYASDQIAKLRDYRKAGMILGKNLIITMETGDCPLNNKDIERIIGDYLL